MSDIDGVPDDERVEMQFWQSVHIGDAFFPAGTRIIASAAEARRLLLDAAPEDLPWMVAAPLIGAATPSRRRYSLEEIDRMRYLLKCIHDIEPGVTLQISRDADALNHEEDLRTLMMNGTDPLELEASALAIHPGGLPQLAKLHMV